jgi:glycosyltransferase involved in cell wall biosynthesis/Ser/Thr protein kinase RdoA (MazF antagonist)
MSRNARIPFIPRPSRVSARVAARLGRPAIDLWRIRNILDYYGLRLVGAPRNLGVGRRSRNMAVPTDHDVKVVKLYRPQWTPARVRYGHSILGRLHELHAPAPRLARARDGATWVCHHHEVFAVFDFVPGTNYSSSFLRGKDRTRLMMISGESLARLHRRLDGFAPKGEHHLGFVSPTGACRRDVAWHAAKLDELKARSANLTDPKATAVAGRLIDQADRVLEEIDRLDRSLSDAAFLRLVIHGDYGLHNLIFQSTDEPVPVDFELSRVDWRVNDLIVALAKYRTSRGVYDTESMEAFMLGYADAFPLTTDERRLLPDAWRLYKLRAAVQYWNSYFQIDGPIHRLALAQDSIDQSEWLLKRPALGLRLGQSREPLPHTQSSRPARVPQLLNERDGSTPPSQRTVMHVTPTLEIGGGQEGVRTLAKYLPRIGYPSIVCAFRDGPLRPEIEKLGIPVKLLPTRRYSVVALPLFLIEMSHRRRDLLELIAGHEVGIILTRGLGTLNFLVMTLRFGGNIQVWWTIGNVIFMVRNEHVGHTWLLAAKQAAHRRLYRAGAAIVNGIIAVSDETARSFRETIGYWGDKIEVVYNGVDVESYPRSAARDTVRARLGFRPEDHVMTMVATFKRQKGHRYLVAAAASVVPRFPDLHIVLVGEGQLRNEIEAQVKAEALADHVHFLGNRRDVPELLAASDSFVLPSLWEGMSMALLEAMASRLPIIATAVSGTSQVMVDGVTGWLVPPGDVDALAGAMIKLLSDALAAARVAAAAQERVVSSFSARAQAEQVAAMFRRESRPA